MARPAKHSYLLQARYASLQTILTVIINKMIIPHSYYFSEYLTMIISFEQHIIPLLSYFNLKSNQVQQHLSPSSFYFSKLNHFTLIQAQRSFFNILYFSGEVLFLFDKGHNIIMIKNKSLQIYTSQQPRLQQLFRFKSLLPKSPEIPLNKNGTQEKTLTFSHTSNYPFHNQIKNDFRFYKTIVNITISQEQLKNVVSISHGNMIKIQKLSKGTGKTMQGKKAQIYYSIYYEVIPYSLKEVATSQRKYKALLPNLTTHLLCQQLLSVMQYLIKENISYQLQLDDIGLTQAGNIKVYISPLLLINSNTQTVSRKKAIDSIDTVIQWWKTTSKTNNQNQNDSQQFSNFLLDTKQLELSPMNQVRTNSASFIQKQTQDEPTQLSTESNIMHKSQVQEDRKNHLNYQRMRKLDRQIKNIRETLKQRVKIKERKEREDNTLKTSTEKEIQKTKTQFIQRLKKEAKFEQPKVQSIQQNIHCINIFHNAVPIALEKIANMHNNNQVLHGNNKIIIQRGKKQVREVAKPNNAVTYHNQIPDDLYHEEEDNLSIDTYDMDMGLDFQTSGNAKNKIPFANRQREKSQCNYKAKKEQSSKTKPGSNQVVNKSVTASAGPKQFKNFVVNFVKPQFMAKKSNIYEDPGEQQSQNSKSVSKKFSGNYKELNEAGKSVTSGTQKSDSLVKQTAHKLQNKIIMNTQPPKINQNSNAKYMKKTSIINTENSEILPQEKLIKQQRSETILGIKKLQDLQIGKKVIEALQKTKKAIAIMNRVRMGSKKTIS